MSPATSVFCSMIDDEIACAMRAGVQLELIYAALMDRAREVGNAVAAQYQQHQQEVAACEG